MSSNDIQLAFGSNLPAHPAPWQGGAMGAPAAAGAGEPSMVKKMHRLLRGRYLLAVALALLGAAFGALGGFLSQKPAYRSDGLIQIDLRVPRSMEMDKVMIQASTYINSTMAKLKNERVIKKALASDKWRALRPNPADITKFNDNLTVQLPPRSNNFIQVSYSDNAPDAQRVAPVAVACVMEAYQELYKNQDAAEIQNRIKYWEDEQKQWDREIMAKRQTIENLARNQEDDPMMLRARDEQLIVLEKAWHDGEEMLAQAKQDVQSAGGPQKYTVEDWARVDDTISKHVAMRNDLQMRAESLEAQLGANHPAAVNARKDLAVRQKTLEAAAEKLASQFVIRWKPDGTGGLLIPRDLNNFAQSVERLRVMYEREAKRVGDMKTVAEQIKNYKDEITLLKAKYQQADEELRELNFQKDFLGPGRVQFLSTGDIAVTDKDRRPMFAAAGFLGGACVPIGLLMLIGLLDSRYRYSDETAAPGGMGGLTLLGILPNLPDRLSDPEQAAIAAHCVHQIRTMLQINSGMEDRRVFAITSASPGDGKTSLTLALGLSYAACGTRTLLIDCDLIGAGLTSRMNVSTPDGVLEAIATRSLLPYVRPTDIADVSILPVGSAGNLHASTLSPAALRRLIEEASKNFEVILVDTGPILGSIEASLVCAAADAVILTVARGQQRPMVEKSLSHLGAIGARLAGVVFNRAQASDFERSISGVSMRSVGVHGPRGSGSQGGRFGPVARAVSTQVVRGDEVDEG
jgi:capsular exopolysaccharide synthesis family protein